MKKLNIAVFPLFVFTLSAVLGAAEVRTFESDTYADFLRGDASNVSLDSQGTLRLSNAVTPAGSVPESIIWSVVADANGNLFAGTGYEGRVLKITPDGKTSTFFDSEETHVTALAFDASGALYAATSPNGKIYRIDASGKGEVYAKTDDKYVWALAFDSAQNLYAGTGDKGIVRKITRAKESSAFFASGDGNIVCLAFDSAGNLLAGGDSRGALYRISPAGKALAIWSSEVREVRAILPRADGSILIASTDARREAEATALPIRAPTTPETQTGGLAPVVTTTVESESIGSMSISTGTLIRAGGPEKKARSTITVLRADGSSRELWRSADETAYAIAEWTQGQILVATGNRGRLYAVAPDGSSGMAAELDSEQCTALVRYGPGRIVCAVNNKVGLFRISDAPAHDGSFTSEVLDAGFDSKWGMTRWRSTGSSVTVSTRSGNTTQPDGTWSEWSLPLKKPAGDPVASPAGRYLQWKVAFSQSAQGEPPTLDWVSISYRQRNAPPVLTSLTICGPGQVFQKSFSTGEGEYLGGGDDLDASVLAGASRDAQQPSATASAAQALPAGKKLYVKGLQTILWTAEDANGDELVYTVSFRGVDEKNWRVMKTGWKDPAFVLDTTTLPDGAYRIRVEASDEKANPKGESGTASRESSVLLVDNTPPRITLAPGGATLSISDALSPIVEIVTSVNGGAWQPLPPKDGLCDGLEETADAPRAQAGQLVVVRATDSRGNFAVLRIAG